MSLTVFRNRDFCEKQTDDIGRVGERLTSLCLDQEERGAFAYLVHLVKPRID